MATLHVRSAAREALGNYLQTELGASVKVSSQWPVPGVRLPAKAATVILAPTTGREHKFPAVALSQTAIDGDAVNALILWTIGIVEFDLQVDVWCEFQDDRDALELQTEQALHRPPAVTLLAATNTTDHAPGLVLAVPKNFNTPAHYRFSAFPSIPENSTVAQAAEWRATWMGSCTAHLLRQTTGPLIKRLLLQQSGSGIPSTDTTQLYP